MTPRQLKGPLPRDFTRQIRVKQLLEREPLARDQLGRAEPHDAIGIERDLDEHEHVAGRRERQIDDRVATEMTVRRRIRRLAFPHVELDRRLQIAACRE